jgi:GTPase Era involved in 16S rRNA processing
MDASKEDLLTNNEENLSTKICVGTYFNSVLGGERIVMFDSPGVNSSENDVHREISHKMLRSKQYNLLVYVINATQLGTNDEDAHLDVVKEQIGRKKVVFIINKIDHLISEDDNLFDVIENQRRFLNSKGFRNPVICPVSSRAAYLVKKSQYEELNRIERKELDAFIDKFNPHSLETYYEEYLHCPSLAGSKNESKDLLKDCGFGYLEQILKQLCNGGKVNGTGLC